MKSLLFVGMGGFIGSISRYSVQLLFNKFFPGHFPFGTLIANVSGCFIIGIIFAYTIKNGGLSDQWKLFLSVGFCGGFTTYSSFSLENINLLQSGHYLTGSVYILSSLLLGFGATILAIILFK